MERGEVGARNMQFMELDSVQRWSVPGVEFTYLMEQRREMRFRYVEDGGSWWLQQEQGGGGAAGPTLAKGPLELINLRPFPQGVYDMACQSSYWEFVW